MIFLPTAVRNILIQVETALKEAENPMIFSTISRKTTAHSFSSLGHSDGIEAAFS